MKYKRGTIIMNKGSQDNDSYNTLVAMDLLQVIQL